MKTMAENYGAYKMLDRVMTLDLSMRGTINKLYDAARELTGELPLTYAAAKKLADETKPGDVVFFLTGLLVRSKFTPEIAESDGPIGIAVLIYTMQRALGITPVIVADETMVKPLETVMKYVGYRRIPIETVVGACAPSKRPTRAYAIITMSDCPDEARKEAEELIDKYDPAAIISCERGGPNEFGVTHNSQGLDISKGHCRSDLLFKAAYERDSVRPVTIGIGDGGNEVGMGNIHDSLYEWLPHGDVCCCGCGGGIIPETKCDVLISSTVSNWGASALAAALAILKGDLGALATLEVHKQAMLGTADAGFIDSPTGEVTTRVDGMDMDVHNAIAEEFAQIARAIINSNASMWEKK